MSAPLRVRRLHPGARLPTRAHPEDAGLDLRALDAVTLEPGERAQVATGIAVELPPGHAGWIVPRSGLAHRHGIALVNAPGLIDQGYRGELLVLLLNTDRHRAVALDAGDRIAQLVIAPVALPAVVEADRLTGSARSDGGFGSSGKR